MNNVYKQAMDRFSQFNEWEADYARKSSPEERLERFAALLDMGYRLPHETVEMAHVKHLENLAQVQKALMIWKI